MTRERKQIETAQDSGWFPTTASVHALAHAKHPFQPLLLWGTVPHQNQGCHSWGECTVVGEGAGLSPTQGFCSSSRVVLATEQRRSSHSHLALALAPLSPAPTPTKLIAASTFWGKTWLMFTPDQTLPWNPLGTHRLYRDALTQGHKFKPRIGNFYLIL